MSGDMKRLNDLLCLFPLKEVAEMLCLPMSTVNNWKSHKDIPLKHRAILTEVWESHRDDFSNERCVFTIGVECSEHNCRRCGFNPEEEERRIRRSRRIHNEGGQI